jgi:hypothetical protein
LFERLGAGVSRGHDVSPVKPCPTHTKRKRDEKRITAKEIWFFTESCG